MSVSVIALLNLPSAVSCFFAKKLVPYLTAVALPPSRPALSLAPHKRRSRLATNDVVAAHLLADDFATLDKRPHPAVGDVGEGGGFGQGNPIVGRVVCRCYRRFLCLGGVVGSARRAAYHVIRGVGH